MNQDNVFSATIRLPEVLTHSLLPCFNSDLQPVSFRVDGRARKYKPLLNLSTGGVHTIEIEQSSPDILHKWFCSEVEILEYKFPKGIKKIDNGCFSSCKFSCPFIFPETLEEIGDYALCHLNEKQIVIPEGVKKIGTVEFEGFPNLFLPKSLRQIGEFYSYLTSVHFASGDVQVKKLENCGDVIIETEGRLVERDGAIIDTADGRLLLLKEGVMTIPQGVKIIPYDAVNASVYINHQKKLILPEGLEKVDLRMFRIEQSDNEIEEIVFPQSLRYIHGSLTSLKSGKVVIPKHIEDYDLGGWTYLDTDFTFCFESEKLSKKSQSSLDFAIECAQKNRERCRKDGKKIPEFRFFVGGIQVWPTAEYLAEEQKLHQQEAKKEKLQTIRRNVKLLDRNRVINDVFEPLGIKTFFDCPPNQEFSTLSVEIKDGYYATFSIMNRQIEADVHLALQELEIIRPCFQKNFDILSYMKVRTYLGMKAFLPESISIVLYIGDMGLLRKANDNWDRRYVNLSVRVPKEGITPEQYAAFDAFVNEFRAIVIQFRKEHGEDNYPVMTSIQYGLD